MSHLVRALVLVGLFSGFAYAQLGWSDIPAEGPRLEAFVYPPQVRFGEAALVLHCQLGAFFPVLKLGLGLVETRADYVWVETFHDGELTGAGAWRFDPDGARAMPLDARHSMAVADALLNGGSLRVAASLTDGEPALSYSFGLDDYQNLRSQLPCLSNTEHTLQVDEWRYYPDVGLVFGGDRRDKGVVFYCTNQLTVGLYFHADSDPLMPTLNVWIGGATPDYFAFQRVGEGFYEGDGWAMLRTFEAMANSRSVSFGMVSAAWPYVSVSNYAGLVAALGNLSCLDAQ